MVFHGHVKDGIIVVDGPDVLPEGAEVRIQVVTPQAAPNEAEVPSLHERLKPFIGAAKGLPPDLSAQHDHYLYGTPKRT